MSQMQTKEVREQMFEYIKAWESSNISQKKFCEQVKLSYHVFHYWYKVYRNNSKSATSSFVKIQVAASPTLSAVELICSDGKRLLFYEPVSADYLKVLIS